MTGSDGLSKQCVKCKFGDLKPYAVWDSCHTSGAMQSGYHAVNAYDKENTTKVTQVMKLQCLLDSARFSLQQSKMFPRQ